MKLWFLAGNSSLLKQSIMEELCRQWPYSYWMDGYECTSAESGTADLMMEKKILHYRRFQDAANNSIAETWECGNIDTKLSVIKTIDRLPSSTLTYCSFLWLCAHKTCLELVCYMGLFRWVKWKECYPT